MKKLLRFGYPAGLEFFLCFLAFNVLLLAYHAHDHVAVGTAVAVTIAINWDMVSYVPLLGINISVTSLVGRYMGAGRPDLAHRATMSGLKIAMCYSLIVAVVFSCFSEYLVGVFRPFGADAAFAQGRDMGVFMVRMVSIYVLADAMIVVFGGALRGAGDTLWSMCVSVGAHWVLVPLIIVLLKFTGSSPELTWTVMVFVILAFGGLFYYRYRGGKWRTMSVLGEGGPGRDEDADGGRIPSAPLPDAFHEPADL